MAHVAGPLEFLGQGQAWGFSPALDLLDPWFLAAHREHMRDEVSEPGGQPPLGTSAKEEVRPRDPETDVTNAVSDKEPRRQVRVLVAGAADARHVLLTLSRVRRWAPHVCELTIFVCEESLDSVARQLLLLLVACDSRRSAEVRAQLLLEIWGNAALRASTARAVDAYARTLLRLLDRARRAAAASERGLVPPGSGDTEAESKAAAAAEAKARAERVMREMLVAEGLAPQTRAWTRGRESPHVEWHPPRVRPLVRPH